ncbi:hypothetical protein Q4Q39_06950 [Flavivirga amylovorans]|uniref:Uncharacterized protein n=1 Tax=Flavivirga amylovorans TaxID=870486 RepID=A0ABT8X0H8_9FLAO|nr:hypothetical protein [Flavivirga amylovorans]MDO5987129.1 hypothetical protein [Flavivirga amylovorans]
MELKNQLDLHLKKIGDYQEHFFNISKVILRLFENEKQKDLKLCVMSALKRALSTMEGIKVLIENKNFTCAAPLSRMYLDNLIRLHAFSLCDNPNNIAIEVLSGKKIKDLKDKNDKKMYDSYLVESLSTDYPWIINVYDRTSGYVHFSFQHHLNMIVGQEENENFKRTFYYMSKDDSHVKIGSWLELTTLVLEVSKALSKLIRILLNEELEEIK